MSIALDSQKKSRINSRQLLRLRLASLEYGGEKAKKGELAYTVGMAQSQKAIRPFFLGPTDFISSNTPKSMFMRTAETGPKSDDRALALTEKCKERYVPLSYINNKLELFGRIVWTKGMLTLTILHRRNT